jgi:hypothetical protein
LTTGSRSTRGKMRQRENLPALLLLTFFINATTAWLALDSLGDAWGCSYLPGQPGPKACKLRNNRPRKRIRDGCRISIKGCSRTARRRYGPTGEEAERELRREGRGQLKRTRVRGRIAVGGADGGGGMAARLAGITVRGRDGSTMCKDD